MKPIDLNYEDFLLGESAYFYEVFGDIEWNDQYLEDLFSEIMLESEARETRGALPFLSFWTQIGNSKGKVAGIVFSRNFSPTFIVEEKKDHLPEVRYSYLFLFAYKNIVAIVKKNIKGLDQAIEDTLIPLPNDVLTKSLLKEGSVFRRINMQSSDPTSQTYQNKTLVALDLTPLQSPVQNYKYAVRNAQFSSDGRNFVVNLRSSKIQEGTSKVSVEEVLNWVELIVDQFSELYQGDTILDTFANRTNFKKRPRDLEPTVLNLLTGVLESELIQGGWEIFERKRGGKMELQDLESMSSILNRNLPIRKESDSNRYTVLSEIRRPIHSNESIYLELLKTKIKLHSSFLNRFYIFENGQELCSIQSYYNREQDFIVLFNKPEYSYLDGVLFQRNFIVKAHQVISPVIIGEKDLKNCLSEKGHLVNGQSHFDPNSIFGFIENKLAPQHSLNHLICDDFGNPEYADYIGIGDRSINFYVGKGKSYPDPPARTSLSASSMHDAIAQVEKNLFYLTNGLEDWTKVKNKWKKLYRAGSQTVKVDIPRVRTAIDDLAQIQEAYNQVMVDTNKNLSFYVVVNFLSKVQFVKELNSLKDGKKAQPQVYQLVWMIAQTISLCNEQGVKFFLVCQD